MPSQVANAVTNLMKHYKWTRAKLVVEPDGHPEVGSKFCYLAGSAIRSMSPKQNLSITDWNFGPEVVKSKQTRKEELKLVLANACVQYLLPLWAAAP